MDKVIEKGTVSYTYYYKVPQSATDAYEELKKSSNNQTRQFMDSKEQEHEAMKKISGKDDFINNFFDNAPPSRSFEFLKNLIEIG